MFACAGYGGEHEFEDSSLAEHIGGRHRPHHRGLFEPSPLPVSKLVSFLKMLHRCRSNDLARIIMTSGFQTTLRVLQPVPADTRFRLFGSCRGRLSLLVGRVTVARRASLTPISATKGGRSYGFQTRDVADLTTPGRQLIKQSSLRSTVPLLDIANPIRCPQPPNETLSQPAPLQTAFARSFLCPTQATTFP